MLSKYLKHSIQYKVYKVLHLCLTKLSLVHISEYGNGKSVYLNLGHHSGICLEDLQKTTKKFLTIVCFALQIGVGGVRNIRDSFVSVPVCEGYCTVGKHRADCRCVPPFRRILLPSLAGKVLMMQPAGSSKTPQRPYQTTRFHIPEDKYIYGHSCDNIKPHNPRSTFSRFYRTITVNIWSVRISDTSANEDNSFRNHIR